MNRSAEVIIVGAGMAGLIAARELGCSGRSCIVVEARDRLGGRIWTRPDHFGQPRDVGATFVHWSQPHVWSEVSRYRLPLAARPPIDKTVALGPSGRIEGTLDSLWRLIGSGMDAYCADARTLFPRPYGDTIGEALAEADQQSIADRISSLDVSDDARAIIDGFWAVNCNRPTNDVAASHHLHCVAATGSDWRVFNEACARYKLASGLGGLVDAVYRHGCPEILLNHRVTNVEQDEERVVVRTESDAELVGRACIVAVPLNVLRSIEFVPGLSPTKRQAIPEGAPAGGFKLWARTARVLDASYLCMASGEAPLTFARTEATLADGTLLGFYGPERDRLALDSPEVVESELRTWIPDAQVVELWSHDWCADPFSYETWRVARPGQLTQFGAELRRPEGRLVLAGSDVAAGAWNGFVDGAVESGLYAAAALSQILDNNYSEAAGI